MTTPHSHLVVFRLCFEPITIMTDLKLNLLSTAPTFWSTRKRHLWGGKCESGRWQQHHILLPWFLIIHSHLLVCHLHLLWLLAKFFRQCTYFAFALCLFWNVLPHKTEHWLVSKNDHLSSCHSRSFPISNSDWQCNFLCNKANSYSGLYVLPKYFFKSKICKLLILVYY